MILQRRRILYGFLKSDACAANRECFMRKRERERDRQKFAAVSRRHGGGLALPRGGAGGEKLSHVTRDAPNISGLTPPSTSDGFCLNVHDAAPQPGNMLHIHTHSSSLGAAAAGVPMPPIFASRVSMAGLPFVPRLLGLGRGEP